MEYEVTATDKQGTEYRLTPERKGQDTRPAPTPRRTQVETINYPATNRELRTLFTDYWTECNGLAVSILNYGADSGPTVRTTITDNMASHGVPMDAIYLIGICPATDLTVPTDIPNEELIDIVLMAREVSWKIRNAWTATLHYLRD